MSASFFSVFKKTSKNKESHGHQNENVCFFSDFFVKNVDTIFLEIALVFSEIPPILVKVFKNNAIIQLTNFTQFIRRIYHPPWDKI